MDVVIEPGQVVVSSVVVRTGKAKTHHRFLIDCASKYFEASDAYVDDGWLQVVLTPGDSTLNLDEDAERFATKVRIRLPVEQSWRVAGYDPHARYSVSVTVIPDDDQECVEHLWQRTYTEEELNDD